MTRRPGRRRFLVLAATAATAATTSLAGCGGRLPFTGPTELDAEQLRRMAREGPSTVPETVPVVIEPAFVDAQVDTARGYLEAVPAPFDAEEIPNGAIREQLNHRHESARRLIRRVDGAASPFESLQRAGQARSSCRELRAAWRAIDDDLDAADLLADAPEVRDRVEAFAADWAYVGDDPVRAVRVHAEIESDVIGGRNWADVDEAEVRAPADSPFAAGEVASDLERARVDVETATYLDDRFRKSLDDETDLESRLAAGREALTERVTSRGEALPDREDDISPSALVERDVGTTAGTLALVDLYMESERGLMDLSDDDPEPRLALDILGATEALVAIRAFERLRDRIEAGDDVAIESTGDVVALREDAVGAIEAARTTDRGPGLTRELLPQFARHVAWTDERFADVRDGVTAEGASRDVAGYVFAAETCGVLPDVAGAVGKLLRTA